MSHKVNPTPEMSLTRADLGVGAVSERLKETDLLSVVRCSSTGPWIRIPPAPPNVSRARG